MRGSKLALQAVFALVWLVFAGLQIAGNSDVLSGVLSLQGGLNTDPLVSNIISPLLVPTVGVVVGILVLEIVFSTLPD